MQLTYRCSASMLGILLASALVAAPIRLAESVSTRHAELLQLQEKGPSFVPPVALVAGGALLSLGGTGLTLLGLSLVGIQTSCVAGADCQGNIYRVAAAFIVSGVVLLAGGLVMAILGHIKWATRAEERAAIVDELSQLERSQTAAPKVPAPAVP